MTRYDGRAVDVSTVGAALADLTAEHGFILGRYAMGGDLRGLRREAVEELVEMGVLRASEIGGGLTLTALGVALVQALRHGGTA